MEGPDCHLVMSVARPLMILLLRPPEFKIQESYIGRALADLFLQLSDRLKPRHGDEGRGCGDLVQGQTPSLLQVKLDSNTPGPVLWITAPSAARPERLPLCLHLCFSSLHFVPLCVCDGGRDSPGCSPPGPMSLLCGACQGCLLTFIYYKARSLEVGLHGFLDLS